MKNNAIEIQKIFRKEHKTYYEETKEIAEYLEKNFQKISVVADCSHAELSEGVNSFRTENHWRD